MDSSGIHNVHSNGTALGTQVNSSGVENILSGGVGRDEAINSSTQNIDGGSART